MNDYKSAIRRAYQGEIIGEGLYRLLSERCRDAMQRQKLELIARVEGRTRGVLGSIASGLGIEISAAEIEESIQRRAPELEKLTWQEFIAKALTDWPPYIEQFQALERLAPPCDSHATRVVVNHEKALVEFARLEHAGSAESLMPLLAFLRQ